MNFRDCPEMHGGEYLKLCCRCGASLPKLRRNWCSDECANWWHANHWMNAARRAIVLRQAVYAIGSGDVRRSRDLAPGIYSRDPGEFGGIACEGCGSVVSRVEVDHIERAFGSHAVASCLHHQTNLRALCIPCHRARTREQVATPASRRRRHAKEAQIPFEATP